MKGRNSGHSKSPRSSKKIKKRIKKSPPLSKRNSSSPFKKKQKKKNEKNNDDFIVTGVFSPQQKQAFDELIHSPEAQKIQKNPKRAERILAQELKHFSPPKETLREIEALQERIRTEMSLQREKDKKNGKRHHLEGGAVEMSRCNATTAFIVAVLGFALASGTAVGASIIGQSSIGIATPSWWTFGPVSGMVGWLSSWIPFGLGAKIASLPMAITSFLTASTPTNIAFLTGQNFIKYMLLVLSAQGLIAQRDFMWGLTKNAYNFIYCFLHKIDEAAGFAVTGCKSCFELPVGDDFMKGELEQMIAKANLEKTQKSPIGPSKSVSPTGYHFDPSLFLPPPPQNKTDPPPFDPSHHHFNNPSHLNPTFQMTNATNFFNINDDPRKDPDLRHPSFDPLLFQENFQAMAQTKKKTSSSYSTTPKKKKSAVALQRNKTKSYGTQRKRTGGLHTPKTIYH